MRKDDAEISDWDVADYLKTEEEVRYFLEEILNANDPKLWQMALWPSARASERLASSEPLTSSKQTSIWRAV